MIPKKPVVSIIVTIYNREKYLHQCLDSVLAQTFQDWECVLWDDGSIDNSRAIALEYAGKDRRFVLLGSMSNLGAASSLDSAINNANGAYVGLLDSDDWLAPEAIRKCLKPFMEGLDVGVIYSKYEEVDAEGKFIQHGRCADIPFDSYKFLFQFMAFHFRLFRRSLYFLVGGVDTSLKAATDYDLFLKLSEVTTFFHQPEVLYYYRIHLKQISGDQSLSTVESQKVVSAAIARRGLPLKAQLRLEVIAF